MKIAFRCALPLTIPILAGYVFLGIAFGVLMRTMGYPAWYPILMSAVIYSGALEFAAVSLLNAPFAPLTTLVMGLMLSARHLFYGIPMLDKYADAGKLRLPMIFLLTDETFSLSSTTEVPPGVTPRLFYAAISFLNYSYWLGGTAAGALFGGLLTALDATGIDFALTALFIVLFLEQLKTPEGRRGGAVGILSSALVLALFGSGQMVVLSMAVLLTVLLAGRRVIRRA